MPFTTIISPVESDFALKLDGSDLIRHVMASAKG